MTSPAPGTARVLARFVLTGTLLFGVRSLVWPADAARRPLVVEVAHDATAAQVEQAVEEVILLDVAKRQGWARLDAVVRERILRSLGVVENVSGDTNAAVDRGIALRLHENDTVARERLLSNARRELARDDDAPAATDAAISEHVRSHEDRYREPARMKFRQVFLSAQKRGESLEGDVAKIGETLRTTPDADAALAASLSDPWPWTEPGVGYTRARLDALAGSGFGEAIDRAPIGRWVGPIRSSFGAHFILVEDRVADRAPPLAAVADRARAELATESRERRFEERMRALRARYDVVVTRRP